MLLDNLHMKQNKIIFLLFILLNILSCCSKESNDFIELTSGREMDPTVPRFGIKLKSDNYLYYCNEIMKGEDRYSIYHTGKYKYYKSKDQFNFSEHQNLIHQYFPESTLIDFHTVPDATAYQIKYKLNNISKKKLFYLDNLNEKQYIVFQKMYALKRNTFIEIDSIEFSKDLLQEKLPEPPPPPL